MRKTATLRPLAVRIAEVDLPRAFKPVPPLLTEIGVGLLGFLAAVSLRTILDLFTPGAGPFAVTVPFVLAATLFGRALSGVVCQTLSALFAWYYVLPAHGSFDFVNEGDGPRVIVNVLAGYAVVALAETFRRAVQDAMREREVLLYELEHRVKNSFAGIVASLRLQAREAESEEVERALAAAIGRVESFARAYAQLSHRLGDLGTTDGARYLRELCGALGEALPPDSGVRYTCDADPVPLTRERAVVLGLLVNEVATNSLKHAFGPEGGTIKVSLKRQEEDRFAFTVADDGRGMSDTVRQGARGLRLIEALARQAGGEASLLSSSEGTVFTCTFEV